MSAFTQFGIRVVNTVNSYVSQLSLCMYSICKCLCSRMSLSPSSGGKIWVSLCEITSRHEHNELSWQTHPAELKMGRGGTREEPVRTRRHLSSVKKLYDTHINHLPILTARFLSCVLHFSVCCASHGRQALQTGLPSSSLKASHYVHCACCGSSRL